MSTYHILYQDEHFVAVDKPAGHFVHRPEDPSLHIFVKPENIVLSNLRRQIGRYLYPVHRLDVATSGILVFALSREKAREFSIALQEHRIEKTYWAVCRGWPPDEFKISIPLELDSTGTPVAAETHFRCRARVLLEPLPGSRYPQSLYTFLEATPRTGRYHQIRRHLNRISHPIIGDNDHGDSRHNRFFREKWGIEGLCLRATELRVNWTPHEFLHIQAPCPPKWQMLQDLFESRRAHPEPHQLRSLESILQASKSSGPPSGETGTSNGRFGELEIVTDQGDCYPESMEDPC